MAVLLIGGIGLGLTLGCGDEGTVIEPDPIEESSDPSNSPETEVLDDLDPGRGGISFADSEIFLEFNSTDNDLGVQIFLDGEDWRRVKIYSPFEEPILDIRAKRELRELGITELRFESAEPSPGEVLGLFAPGEYTFAGRTTEGVRMTGTGTLSHDLPDPPDFSPSNGESVDPEDVEIRWKAVPSAESYQVIVESEDTGASMEVELSGDARSLRVPSTFLEPGALYKAEVLAISENGNKTITEGFFNTLP
jgi:hypothetical protein